MTKISIEISPTGTIDEVIPQGGTAPIPVRLWKGTDMNGTEVHAWVAVVQPQTHDPVRSKPYLDSLKDMGFENKSGRVIDMRQII
jgi:hypothetical protein